jgi:glyoxylase-like metal-dependent hydrolase (beta-lactamase superfamily II)/rhodanese-related sulfurtransferase
MQTDPLNPGSIGNADFRTTELFDALPDHLVIRQFYLGCLSQASYLIGDRSTGRSVVVDPRRDIDEVLDAAKSSGLRVDMVYETHFHADFLSGHLELAAATGAEIGISSAGETEFESRRFADGEVYSLGRVELEVWQTPGHTPESSCLVIRAEPSGPPVAVVTGDTLFIGDVGRPDLLASIGFEADDLASMLFDSLNRLLRLPDEVLVLPGHGAGSACGRALASETASTMGAQRRTNYALGAMARSAFIDVVTEGQPAAPGYFVHDAILNRKNRAILDDDRPLAVIPLGDALDQQADGAVLLDVRAPELFALGHLRGSVNVGLGGRFAEMAGTVLAIGTPTILVADAVTAQEAYVRLARIGFDSVLGRVDVHEPAADAPADDAMVELFVAQHPELAERSSRLTATEFATLRAAPESGQRLQVVDVRGPSEVAADPIPGATNVPLGELSQAEGLDPVRPVVVFCAGGYRSSIAASLLRSRGFADVSDVIGGAAAIAAVSASAGVKP